MKLFLVGLFVALASTSPLPLDEENGEPVELIVNGVPEGEPLEIGDIVDIKLKNHVDGQLASVSDLLYPLTAQGLAETAAAAAAEENIPVLPEPVPEVVPMPVLLPEPVLPEVVAPEPVVLPEPVLPEATLPEPVLPEYVPQPAVSEVENNPEIIEETAPEIPNGEIFNDGNVQVSVNVPDETGVFTTIQTWLQLFLNYFNNGVQTTQQII
ncbi:unnamed protein product [Parnassius apollo]|uniref:(apollo) hypothetical protein n=1 Tax=Parnassius apollo TaxID=110799 RepID=A0A8S3XN04_PARAO|nr:unnamed protein product [Parnassius apollo]